jgi:uncharacterized protein YbaA (DUF1428 family)
MECLSSAPDAGLRQCRGFNTPVGFMSAQMAARPGCPDPKEASMPYVDGFVIPVPKKNLPAYRKIAKQAGAVWRDHGALQVRECVGDDVKVGKLTSFPQSVKLKAGETVVFSWIVFKSRAHRDLVNAKVMKDPRLAKMMNPKAAPFDAKRMIYGGFSVMVDL